MNMYCIKVCKEKITYLSFARSTYHNQDCKTNDKSKMNMAHQMYPNEIMQKNHVKNTLYSSKRSSYIKLHGMFINEEFSPV